jgi:catechol 2,3-dioxygenase-like lactoylglutathione lyase family enzyme
LLSGIDHVQLAAPPGCEAAAREFFSKLLGLPEIEKPEALRSRGGCWFQVGSKQIHIGVDATFRPAAKAHVAFAAGNIERLRRTLEKAGIPCTSDETPPGAGRFYATDPWGNRLEFTEPPFCPKPSRRRR